jgi:hypothetical protein
LIERLISYPASLIAQLDYVSDTVLFSSLPLLINSLVLPRLKIPEFICSTNQGVRP